MNLFEACVGLCHGCVIPTLKFRRENPEAPLGEREYRFEYQGFPYCRPFMFLQCSTRQQTSCRARMAAPYFREDWRMVLHRRKRLVPAGQAGRWIRNFCTSAVAASTLGFAPLGRAHAIEPPRRATSALASSGSIDGVPVDRAVAPASLVLALAAVHKNVPAYSRQTGLACSSCHYQFLQLTPFGRLFKLNGYTLTGLQTIGQPGDSAGKEDRKSVV